MTLTTVAKLLNDMPDIRCRLPGNAELKAIDVKQVSESGTLAHEMRRLPSIRSEKYELHTI